jgi:peptidoglycan/xylan/chitin deacetylase (PgdA/CDA1 family)
MPPMAGYRIQPPLFFRWLYPSAYWRAASSVPTVYLTFDDGPVPEVTPWVLDVLKSAGVKASFFCLGRNVEQYPALFQRIRNEGHSIGNHTYSHLKSSKSSKLNYLSDIEKADQYISSTFFRPPYGNLWPHWATSLRKKYKLVFWDVLSEDYDTSKTPDDCFNNVMRYTRNGSVIVFHDSLKAKDRLTPILPQIIQALKHEGYAFKTLADLT